MTSYAWLGRRAQGCPPNDIDEATYQELVRVHGPAFVAKFYKAPTSRPLGGATVLDEPDDPAAAPEPTDDEE